MGADSYGLPANAGLLAGGNLALVRDLSRRRWKKRMLYSLLFVVVLVRWFTETAGILPRALNFADLPLFGLAVVLLFAGNYWRLERCRFWQVRFSFLVVAFSIWALSSVAVNLVLYNIAIIPALISVAFYLEPIAFALLFIALGWNAQDTGLLAKLLVFLGLLQIPTAILEAPKALAASNPDFVSGTFGTDNSQMCFFIVMVMSYMAARYFIERKKRYLLPLPALMAVFYAAGFKALWFALIPTLAFVILIVIPMRVRQRWVLAGAALALAIGIGLPVGYLTSANTTGFLKKKYIDAAYQTGAIWQIGKIQTFLNIPRLYHEVPLAALLGVGPGSYSDRAFLTFTQVSPDPSARTNVTRGLFKPARPGRFATEYILPLVYRSTYLFGSWTIDGPITSYVSLLGELGIVGFTLYLLVYFRLYKLASATVRNSWVKRDVQMFGLSVACVVGVLTLMEMSFLDNWLEVSRVTIPLWLLFVPLFQSTTAVAQRPEAANAPAAAGE